MHVSMQVGGTQFTRAVIRNAGHILPADQPRVSRDMIERFIFNKPFPQ